MGIKDILLSEQWVKEKITKDTRKYFEMKEKKILVCQTYGMQWKLCLGGKLYL